MPEEYVRRIIEKARQDESFFHALIFTPEKVIDKLDFLTREQKGNILTLQPDRLVNLVVGGELESCGETNTCTYTCGVTSTGFTDRLRDRVRQVA